MVSDAVNTASRLESLTKDFGVNILVGENTIHKLTKKDLKYRSLGETSIRGKQNPVRIYHLYGGEPELLHHLYEETLLPFEEGIRLYNEGHFIEASTVFQKVLKDNPQDNACKYFVQHLENEKRYRFKKSV